MIERLLLALVPALLCTNATGQNLTNSFINGAWSGQYLAVKSALESGRVNVDVATPDGHTALMLSSLAGHEKVVTLLLEAGADATLANEAGETALTLAAKYGFTSVAERLLEAGADVNARDASGRSAWTWARWGENEDLQSLLEASGADTSAPTDPFDGGAPIDRFETNPQLTKYRAPELPEELEDESLDGTIELSLVVTRDGEPRSIELMEGLGNSLDEKALEAAEKWRFDPGEVQGRPVDGRVRVALRYVPALKGDPNVMVWTKRWRR